TGNYTYQIIYDTATSIVQGFEMYCNYSGLFDGNQTEMFLYNQIEISDFDLPEFYYEVDIINKPVEPTPTPTPTPSTTTTQEGSVFLGPIITISFFSFWIIIRRKIK
ncbi:MAG: hypothetical protein EAX90_15950, partial [Candidatus Heimdallarchaeota archaeon]|nr:hypothetical protein [Candidatus Heimdallarchaeota archaeon]